MPDEQARPRITLRCANCRTWNRISADRASSGPKCGSCGAQIALDHPLHLDDETFDRVITQSQIPVLVDFYADWCGPCRMMAPAIDQLASSTVGQALIAKVDTDRATATAARFQIRGIPLVIVFRDGKEVRRQTGAVPFSALQALLS